MKKKLIAFFTVLITFSMITMPLFAATAEVAVAAIPWGPILKAVARIIGVILEIFFA